MSRDVANTLSEVRKVGGRSLATEGEWKCFQCHTTNAAKNDFCTHCGASKDEQREVAVVDNADGSWFCRQCGRRNLGHSQKCWNCKAEDPRFEKENTSQPALQAEPNEAWACARCGHQNSGYAKRCWGCNEEKPTSTAQ